MEEFISMEEYCKIDGDFATLLNTIEEMPIIEPSQLENPNEIQIPFEKLSTLHDASSHLDDVTLICSYHPTMLFSSKTDLMNHFYMNHNYTYQEGGGFLCGLCEIGFRGRTQIIDHFRNVHELYQCSKTDCKLNQYYVGRKLYDAHVKFNTGKKTTTHIRYNLNVLRCPVPKELPLPQCGDPKCFLKTFASNLALATHRKVMHQ